MVRRLLSISCVAAVLGATIGVPVSAQTNGAATSTFQVPKATYTPPKTPWGDPDL
jgi:hypothetical protein